MARIEKRGVQVAVAIVVAAAIGLGAGYYVWGWPKNWFAYRDVASLPAGPQTDLIRYGLTIIEETPQTIGPLAAEPAMRFAGNQLKCANCHLNGGLQPFASPYVSTFASYPLMAMDRVETLTERINGCLVRSMNGKPLPEDGHEMNAMIAYIQYLGVGTPEGVRLPGMGLLPLPKAAESPDMTRGATVFGNICAKCHGADGQGSRNTDGQGYTIPPLWGDGSFNAASGMATIDTAAAFIHANMPRGIDYRSPILTVQQAWDVAAFVTTQPRPPGPPAGTP